MLEGCARTTCPEPQEHSLNPGFPPLMSCISSLQAPSAVLSQHIHYGAQ